MLPGDDDVLYGGAANIDSDHFSLVTVTDPLPPGTHQLGLVCGEKTTNFAVDEAHIAAVSLSAD